MGTEFSNRLHELILHKGVSQSVLADLIGAGRQNMSKYIKGTLPKVDFLRKLATFYPNLNLNWLVTGQGDMFMIDYGSKIKYLRIANGNLSQSEASKKCNIDLIIFREIEANISEPSIEQIQKVCECFNIPLEYFNKKDYSINQHLKLNDFNEPKINYQTQNELELKDQIIESLKRELESKDKIIKLLEK